MIKKNKRVGIVTKVENVLKNDFSDKESESYKIKFTHKTAPKSKNSDDHFTLKKQLGAQYDGGARFEIISHQEALYLANKCENKNSTEMEDFDIPKSAQYKLGDYIKDSKKRKQRYGRIVKINLELSEDLRAYKTQKYKIQYQGGVGDKANTTTTKTDTVTLVELENAICHAYHKDAKTGNNVWIKDDNTGKDKTKIRYSVHKTKEQALAPERTTDKGATFVDRRRLLPLTGYPRRQF